jgi:predicted GNAT family N-acyltransferase
VAVHPECQRRGIGERLLVATLALPHRADAVVMLVATALGRPLYLRHGFVDVAAIVRCSGVPHSAGQTAAVPLEARWRPDAIALDAQASGARRGAVLAAR